MPVYQICAPVAILSHYCKITCKQFGAKSRQGSATVMALCARARIGMGAMKRKRGRPSKRDYVTSWDEKIEGAYMGADGRLRPIGRSTPAFGGDEATAVHRFRKWLAAQDEKPKPHVPVALPSSIDAFDQTVDHLRGFRGKLDIHVNNPEHPREILTDFQGLRTLFRDYFRNLILTEPKRAAAELDVEHLAWYPPRPDKPQFSLLELHDFYLKNKRNRQGKTLAKKHKENSARWWSEFMRIVNVDQYRALTLASVRKYRDAIMSRFDKPSEDPERFSASSVRNRFAKIKAVFNFGLQECDEKDKDDIRRVLDLCLVLKAPAEEFNPRPIPVDAFKELLAVAKPREKAILLLGLNCCMHSGEVAQTLRADVDTRSGTLAARRTKNRRPRAAALWRRTVDAIRAYQALKPHQSRYLFVARTGSPVDVRQLFMTLRKNAGLPKTLTFEGLRDAVLTSAEEEDVHHAKFVAGHKTGMTDRYVLRQATNKRVVACCEAIERYFFGSEDVSRS